MSNFQKNFSSIKEIINVYSIFIISVLFIILVVFINPKLKIWETFAASGDQVETISHSVIIHNYSSDTQTYRIEIGKHRCPEMCGRQGSNGGGCSVCDTITNHYCNGEGGTTSLEVNDNLEIPAGGEATVSASITTPDCGSAQLDIKIIPASVHRFSTKCGETALCNMDSRGGSRGGPGGGAVGPSCDEIIHDGYTLPYQVYPYWAYIDTGRDDCNAPPPDECLNGVLDPGEECDPTAPDGETCAYGSCTQQCTCPGEPGPECFYTDDNCHDGIRIVASKDPGEVPWFDLPEASVNAIEWGFDTLYIGGLTQISGDSSPRLLGQHRSGNEDDSVVTISGPNGYNQSVHCTSSEPCDIGPISVSTLAAGLYTVTSKVDQDYGDSNCSDVGFFRIAGGPPPSGGFVIEKTLAGRQEYEPDEEMTFTVTIANTGEVSYDDIEFLDHYQHRYLGLIHIEGNKRGSSTSVNLDPYVEDYQPDPLIVGRTWFRIANLATHLGTLNPGDVYELRITFRALDNNNAQRVETDNWAIVRIGDEEDQDDAVVVIKKPYIPPTDK